MFKGPTPNGMITLSRNSNTTSPPCYIPSETLTLTCTQQSGQQPTATVSWFRNGVLSGTGTTLSLTSSGTYTCELSNACGSLNTTLLVRGKINNYKIIKCNLTYILTSSSSELVYRLTFSLCN